jgi:anti-sigma regulatory factor (Ser/Thr protein kinase)
MAGVGAEWRASFPGTPASAGRARAFVASALAAAGRQEVTDVVVLLASELVTNAVLHSGTVIEVVVRVLPDRLAVEVHDQTAGEPARRHYSATSGTGRGLVLVEELARDWGTVLTASGKFVWFELALTGEPSAVAKPAKAG